MRDKIVLPIKCSTVKTIDSWLQRIVAIEFAVYCILSVIVLIYIFACVGRSFANTPYNTFVFISAYFGTAFVVVFILIYISDLTMPILNRIPTIKLPRIECIKDVEESK